MRTGVRVGVQAGSPGPRWPWRPRWPGWRAIRPRPADLALFVAVLIAGTVQRHAVYTLAGVLFLVACVGLLFGALLRGPLSTGPLSTGPLATGTAGSAPRPGWVAAAVLATVWFLLIKPPWGNVVSTALLPVGFWVTVVAALTVLGPLLVPPRWRWPVAVGTLAATAAGYLLVIRGSVRALIDVWVILQSAALGAAHGQNPYRMTFGQVPAGQVNDCFNYLPVTFLAPLPSRLLLGDVRYAEAAVLLAGVVALAWRVRPAGAGRSSAVAQGSKVAQSSRVALPLALLVGLLPGSLRDVQQAWNEAILVGALVGAALLADRGRSWWAVACVAAALATKQHVLLLVPLLAFWPAFGPRRALVAAAGGGALCLPWYLWDPHRFTHCTVDFFLDLPARPDSLSVWHWLPAGLGTPVLLLSAVAAYAVALRRLPRDGAGLLLGWALILAAWDLVNKQSFLNQWLLVAQLTVAALALSAGRVPTPPVDSPPPVRLTTGPSAD